MATRPNFRHLSRPVPDIGVWPRDEEVRRTLKHYPTGRGFENYPDATPWPNDQFTKRRMRDGEITETPTERERKLEDHVE